MQKTPSGREALRDQAEGRREPPGSVAIIGLGLIGGSLARDLARCGVRVLAHDIDEATLHAAVAAGAVHDILHDDFVGVEKADVVVIAVTVDRAPGILEVLASRDGPAVTDVGSTKASIMRVAEELGMGDRFLGSHPLAGDHRGGWSSSREGLFHGATVYICAPSPTRSVRISSRTTDALQRVQDLWHAVGARPEHLDAHTHDQRLAWSSHLPQVVSTVLALTLRTVGVRAAELGSGGRDVTRLAGSAAEVWTPICLDNATNLTAALQAVEQQLASLREALEARDDGAVHDVFAAAHEWAAARE
ncbi:hypothetical protein BH23GEM9_BH23GEM9_33150 [soil metagenome]